ncbi:hypothetical protein L7F22_015927 [Adiantum nelumboides]|nr:hypothetical protein [Adiantum nelumboides]
MAASASLVELCGRAMAELANRDAAKCQELFLLPSHLLAHIIPLLSPVALESLQTKPDFKLSFEESCGRSHSKQQSNLKRTFDAMMDGCSLCCLNGAWKKHFDKRWPAGGFRKLRFEFLLSPTEIMLLNLNDDEDLIDWRQRFWETHVQECLNEAVARISTSHHQGSLYKINLSNFCKLFVI